MSMTQRVVRSLWTTVVKVQNGREKGTPGLVERFCGWGGGWLLVAAGARALRRGDTHEFNHIKAAVETGNTSPGSHRWGCPLEGKMSEEMVERVAAKIEELDHVLCTDWTPERVAREVLTVVLGGGN